MLAQIIRFRFGNHAQQKLTSRLEFQQPAVDEIRSGLLFGAGVEALGEPWELLGVRGGYGGGWVRKCYLMLTGRGRWARDGG